MTTLTLGTAQLGMDYGVANDSGKPNRADAICIVRQAIEGGISSFDTARCYGDAEEILGEALFNEEADDVRVITKLDPLGHLGYVSSESAITALVDESVLRSCEALGRESIDVLLLHAWSHRHICQGAIWCRLLQLREQGKIRALGASVYEPAEAIAALGDPDIRYLQIPVNVLDWRWKIRCVHTAIAQRPDVTVHARSALLQGLLSADSARWPDVPELDAVDCVLQLAKLARQFQRESVIDLCFAYVRAQRWVDSVVVGCETLAQLCQNLRLFALPVLTPEQCADVEGCFSAVPEPLLNPSKWNIKTMALAKASA